MRSDCLPLDSVLDGVCLSDVKPRNIARMDKQWNLIDLDASAKIKEQRTDKYSEAAPSIKHKLTVMAMHAYFYKLCC